MVMMVATLIGVTVLAGNDVAFVKPIFGYVDTTAADGEIIMLWVDDDRTNNPNWNASVAIWHLATSDSYYFQCIESLLLAHGKSIGDPFNVTVAMLGNGADENGNPYTSTYHNDTDVTKMDTYGTVGPTWMPMLNLESCAAEETFSKILCAGWNLISLPFAPSDNSANTVLSGVSYDAVYRYNATLITSTTGASKPDKNSLFFNNYKYEGGLTNGTYSTEEGWSPPTDTAIRRSPQTRPPSIQLGNNTTRFQDSGDYLCMANAILKLEKGEEVVVEIDSWPAFVCADPACRTTVNITLRWITDYGSDTIDPCYDNSVVGVELVGRGDSSEVYPGSLNSPLTISAYNTDGLSGGVAFANVTFYPKGSPGEYTCPNLTVDSLYDRNYTALQTVVVDCCPHPSALHIIESDPPWVSPPVANPLVILNDTRQMRGRKSGTDITNLTVHITDATSVEAVYANLTPILGAGHDMIPMIGTNGTMDGDWYKKTNASYSRLASYCLDVMAVDLHGNWNNGSCITLEVRRRGDVKGSDADNKVTGKDYYRIARWTVHLEPEPNTLRGNVVPAESWNGIDMADALYVAMYWVGTEDVVRRNTN